MKFVELYFDAEIANEWGITIWDIDQIDFDPMNSTYDTIPTTWKNVAEARKAQEAIAEAFKLDGHKVYMNHFSLRAHFWVTPRWIEEMHYTQGRVLNGTDTTKEGCNTTEMPIQTRYN